MLESTNQLDDRPFLARGPCVTKRRFATMTLAVAGLTMTFSFLGGPVAAAPFAVEESPPSWSQPADRPDRVPGEVAVRFRADVDADTRRHCHDHARTAVLSELPH